MEIDLAIKRTIRYADRYKTQLNGHEIGERLLSKSIFPETLILKKTKDNKNKNEEYFFIKMDKAINIAKIIETKFKDILFLGISGSVASGHPKKNDDIDFLIITKKNRLWKTRLLMRWWIFIKKIPHRKYGEKEKKDQFCFNLWLDESSLALPGNKQNLRNAVDLILLKPLINKKNIYEKFIKGNDWAKKWVATPYHRLLVGQPTTFLNKTKNKLGDEIMNQIYFWPQYWYMKRKITDEQISLHTAFFHRPMVK